MDGVGASVKVAVKVMDGASRLWKSMCTQGIVDKHIRGCGLLMTVSSTRGNHWHLNTACRRL